ncbi:MAG: response regulator transcription factor [Lachnospiraceae bacterium]
MKKVLIVDDEKSSAEIISYFIKEYQLPLEILGIASRGDIALKEIKRVKPDIVFLDIEMPFLNGLQVIEEANNSGYSNTVYIVITAFNKFDYAQKALRLGAKDLLLKPVQYNQFCETMQRVIGYQYSNNALFNQLLEYIHEHYTEDLELSDCATALSTSTNNILRMFKKYLDTNFTAYYNKLRINKALELLAKGYAIKEAAHAVGYHNLNYFYRKFKEQVGMTPKEYVSNENRAF